MAKDWGTTGFMYRSDLVKERPTSWRQFFDLAKTKYSRKVSVLDGIPEVIGSTLVMLGYSYNSDSAERAGQGEEGAAGAEAAPAHDHVDAVQAGC